MGRECSGLFWYFKQRPSKSRSVRRSTQWEQQCNVNRWGQKLICNSTQTQHLKEGRVLCLILCGSNELSFLPYYKIIFVLFPQSNNASNFQFCIIFIEIMQQMYFKCNRYLIVTDFDSTPWINYCIWSRTWFWNSSKELCNYLKNIYSLFQLVPDNRCCITDARWLW